MKLTVDTSKLDAAIGRLEHLAGAWKTPALEEMRASLEQALRAKLEGNPRARGLVANLRVRVSGQELLVTFPDFAERFQAADFARGDLSSYTDSLGAIATRVVAELLQG